MTSIKIEPFDGVAGMIRKLPDPVRQHLESVVAEPVSRREVVDLLVAQQALNIGIVSAVVALGEADKDGILRTLKEMVQ